MCMYIYIATHIQYSIYHIYIIHIYLYTYKMNQCSPMLRLCFWLKGQENCWSPALVGNTLQKIGHEAGP